MLYSCKVSLRTDSVKSDGTHSINLILIFNRKVKRKSLGYSVSENFWDSKKGLVKASHQEARNINLVINSTLLRAKGVFLAYQLKNKPLTFELFEREFDVKETKCFYSFVKNELELAERNNYYADETKRQMNSEITKLQKFRLKLTFDDIDVAFLDSYKGYMKTKLLNKVNTIHKSHKFIRTFISKAYAKGIVDDNVFKKYKLKTEQGRREHLGTNELKTLQSLYSFNTLSNLEEKYYTDLNGEQIELQIIDKSLCYSLRLFLFACYTGLRFQDIKDLKWSNIRFGESPMISLTMHKTKDYITIPITDKSISLFDDKQNSVYVFKVPCNQVINKHIKKIASLVGIKKNLSFHSARHTFATISLDIGLPLPVISKLLGHKDLKTTMIYTKVPESMKTKEMNKWNF